MSVRMMAAVFDMELPSTEKFVLLVLADHADDYGWNAYPSVRTITRKSSLCERAVQNAIKTLRDRGLLVKEPSASRLGTTAYRIVLPEGGAPPAPLGVHLLHPGGAPAAPNPSSNHPSTTLFPSLPRRRKSKEVWTDERTHPLIACFFDEHQRVLGQKYITKGARDTACLKTLLDAGYSPEAIRDAVPRYFGDKFHLRGVVSIPRFCDLVPTLLAGTSTVFPGKHSPPPTAFDRAASRKAEPPPWTKGKGDP